MAKDLNAGAPASSEPRPENPYRTVHARMSPPGAAWDEGFAAGRAAATPDPPTDERRPWPIAPDTVMPPRRQPVRWGSRADDPPTEIHDDPGKTKAYLAGLAAGRTEAAAASPDERLREALRTMIDVYDRHDRWCGHYAQAPGDGIIHRIDGARNALAAADREAHLEPAPQNDATRAQIVAAKLIADREAPDEAEGQKITHGRHCTCTPCAVEDWTNPAFAPCGMHGKDCPQEYQPLGPAGSFTPPADEPKETTT